MPAPNKSKTTVLYETFFSVNRQFFNKNAKKQLRVKKSGSDHGVRFRVRRVLDSIRDGRRKGTLVHAQA